MAVTATLTTVQQEGPKFYLNFDDGTQREFATLAAMQAWVESLDKDVVVAHQFLVGWWLARDTDASNPGMAEGRTIVVDLSAPNPVRVS